MEKVKENKYETVMYGPELEELGHFPGPGGKSAGHGDTLQQYAKSIKDNEWKVPAVKKEVKAPVKSAPPPPPPVPKKEPAPPKAEEKPAPEE